MVFSLFAIVFVLSWLYPLIGLLIRLESKGPVCLDNYEVAEMTARLFV
jgi:hypothetical protein